MKRFSILAIVAASVIAAPLLAGPPVKRPYCQVPRAQARDSKRAEGCRKAPIPPLVDPTPMYLISTTGLQAPVSDLS